MSSRRRVRIPETEKEVWRRVFLDEVLNRPRVQNIITQDLRALWKKADREFKNVVAAKGWQYMDERYPGDGITVLLPSETHYHEELRRVVRDSLRCRHRTEAAPWFVKQFSRAVADCLPEGPFFPKPAEQPPIGESERDLYEVVPHTPRGESLPLFEVSITLQVGPFGALIQRDTLDIPANAPMVNGGDGEQGFPDRDGTWDDWEEFEVAARRLLDESLEILKTNYRDRFPTQRNPGTTSRFAQDAKDLAAYLIDKHPFPDPPHWERLRRFAALIGLDFPVQD